MDSSYGRNRLLKVKSRGNSSGSGSGGLGENGDFVMLQRPTILLKQQPSQQQVLLKKASTDVKLLKDENLKPVVSSIITNKQINKSNNITNGVVSSEHQRSINNGNNTKPNIILAQSNTNIKNSNQIIHVESAPSLVTVNATPTQSIEPKVQQQTSSNFIDSLQNRLNGSLKSMTRPVKILDENLIWMESLQEYLLDQNNDYLVIGVLGKKGVGKSTLMSYLAGSGGEPQNTIFKLETSKDTKEIGNHKTNGVHAFITNERTILLDVQPILCSSMLERAILIDKQYSKLNSSSGSNSTAPQNSNTNSNDFKYYENLVEIQSIELTCFVLSICQVVIVMEDWFSDTNLFRLLQTAEMLMPNLTSIGNNVLAGNERGTGLNIQDDMGSLHQYPHLFYILNKSDCINKPDMAKMKSYMEQLMKDSKLKFKGSTLNTNSRNNIKHISSNKQMSNQINFVLIPNNGGNNQNENDYIGSSSFDKSIKCLLKDLLSVKRTNTLFNNMNEKKWFTFANKVWDSIKKSPMISEYYRLMT